MAFKQRSADRLKELAKLMESGKKNKKLTSTPVKVHTLDNLNVVEIL